MKDITQIEINKHDFYSFDDTTLGWKCIEPAIQKVRGKSLSIKSHVYNQLTDGQQSLLMFWILHGHGRHGILGFFNEVDYLLGKTDIWKEFNDKFRKFGDIELLSLIMEMENFYLC
jgi:hypothetical protein